MRGNQICKPHRNLGHVSSVSRCDLRVWRLVPPPDMIAFMAAFCLSIHARYQCRHAGACCQNWTLPAEPHVVEFVKQRGLRPRGVTGPLFVSSRKPDPRDGAMDIARDNNGVCVFFEHDAGRLCVIHREAGIDALPSACRHFPRKFLRDGRGTFISLSHFCPTAAIPARRLAAAPHRRGRATIDVGRSDRRSRCAGRASAAPPAGHSL